MRNRDESYLIDIWEAAKLVQSFIKSVDKRNFDGDLLRQSAVVRQLEVIGEATKRLSEEFRRTHMEIPWRKMAGMRDLLIHAYDHVDMDAVWNAATVAIPALVEKIRPLVPNKQERKKE